jgi:hypothetical protein
MGIVLFYVTPQTSPNRKRFVKDTPPALYFQCVAFFISIPQRSGGIRFSSPNHKARVPHSSQHHRDGWDPQILAPFSRGPQ